MGIIFLKMELVHLQSGQYMLHIHLATGGTYFPGITDVD
jgi:hypothetical protein